MGSMYVPGEEGQRRHGAGAQVGGSSAGGGLETLGSSEH